MGHQNLCAVMFLLMLMATPPMSTADMQCYMLLAEPPLICELEDGTFNIICKCDEEYGLDENANCPGFPKDKPQKCIANGYKPGKKAECWCNPNGYYGERSTELVCGADSQWIGELPVCKKACPKFETMEPLRCSYNGYTSDYAGGYKHGDYVICTCYPALDYHTDGIIDFECNTEGRWIKHPNVEGHWNGGFPSCFKYCPETEAPLHCNRFSIEPGINASCRCDPPYVLEDNEAKYDCRSNGSWMRELINGSWIEELPKCIKQCPALRTPVDEKALVCIEDGFKPGDKAYCECRPSDEYYKEGGTNFTCAGGSWIGEWPKCKKFTTTTTTTITGSVKEDTTETETTMPADNHHTTSVAAMASGSKAAIIIMTMLWMVMICCGAMDGGGVRVSVGLIVG